jgi:hypothetical protein
MSPFGCFYVVADLRVCHRANTEVRPYKEVSRMFLRRGDSCGRPGAGRHKTCLYEKRIETLKLAGIKPASTKNVLKHSLSQK